MFLLFIFTVGDLSVSFISSIKRVVYHLHYYQSLLYRPRKTYVYAIENHQLRITCREMAKNRLLIIIQTCNSFGYFLNRFTKSKIKKYAIAVDELRILVSNSFEFSYVLDKMTLKRTYLTRTSNYVISFSYLKRIPLDYKSQWTSFCRI